MEIKRINFDNLDFTHFFVSKDKKTIMGMAKEELSTKLHTFLFHSGFAKIKKDDRWFDLSYEDTRRLKEIIQRYFYFNGVHIYKAEDSNIGFSS